MLTTLKKPAVQKWTWPGARFVRQTASEKRFVSRKRLQVYIRARFYDTTTGEFISKDPLETIDGPSMYRGYFVPNDVDYSGRLCLPPISFCGPDVSTQIIYVLNKLNVRFKNWKRKDRIIACAALVSPFPGKRGPFAAVNAWDIDRLFNKGWINRAPYSPPCAKPASKCRDTVEVFGQCYYAGSVNYVLLGHMARLCAWGKGDLTALIDLYKGPIGPPVNRPAAGNWITSRDFAKAGYDNWPFPGKGIQPAPDRGTCRIGCPVPYAGPNFKFYWETQGWN